MMVKLIEIRYVENRNTICGIYLRILFEKIFVQILLMDNFYEFNRNPKSHGLINSKNDISIDKIKAIKNFIFHSIFRTT